MLLNTHIANRPSGLLASQTGYQLPIRVLKSAAGFYIGTCLDYEGPVSRESVEYWPTQSAAIAALQDNTWTQRSHP